MAFDSGLDHVNDLSNRMVVDDPNEGALVFYEADVSMVTDELCCCIVGQFLTEKAINYQAI